MKILLHINVLHIFLYVYIFIFITNIYLYTIQKFVGTFPIVPSRMGATIVNGVMRLLKLALHILNGFP